MKQHRKRSKQITLVLLGASILTACSDSPVERRDLYASKADCVADWNDESKCEAAAPVTTSGVATHRTGSYYYGPRYFPGQYGADATHHAHGAVTTPRTGSKALATTHSSSSRSAPSRSSSGGFGSSAARHSSAS